MSRYKTDHRLLHIYSAISFPEDRITSQGVVINYGEGGLQNGRVGGGGGGASEVLPLKRGGHEQF